MHYSHSHSHSGSGSKSYSKKSKKSSKPKELEANLKDDHGDLIGEALITFDDEDMTIDLELDDLPKACDDGDCFVAIHKGDCDDLGRLYFKGGRRPNHPDNPWSPFESDFESDEGEASFDFETSNGKDYNQNEGKVMVIYTEKPKYHSKSKKSKKSGSRKIRVLMDENQDEVIQRNLHLFSRRHRRSPRNRKSFDLDDYNDFACGRLKES